MITGDESLRQRPMLRVVEPLRQMGAYLDGREKGNTLPVCVRGGRLKGISFFNKKSSAQVKSDLLLAGLRAEGYTEIVEPVLSRDHRKRQNPLKGLSTSPWLYNLILFPSVVYKNLHFYWHSREDRVQL